MELPFLLSYTQSFPKARVRIIYGGSVDSNTIMTFLTRGVSDGVLIGSASSMYAEMKKIITRIHQQ